MGLGGGSSGMPGAAIPHFSMVSPYLPHAAAGAGVSRVPTTAIVSDSKLVELTDGGEQ